MRAKGKFKVVSAEGREVAAEFRTNRLGFGYLQGLYTLPKTGHPHRSTRPHFSRPGIVKRAQPRKKRLQRHAYQAVAGCTRDIVKTPVHCLAPWPCPVQLTSRRRCADWWSRAARKCLARVRRHAELCASHRMATRRACLGLAGSSNLLAGSTKLSASVSRSHDPSDNHGDPQITVYALGMKDRDDDGMACRAA
jgi:hypothetical protein